MSGKLAHDAQQCRDWRLIEASTTHADAQVSCLPEMNLRLLYFRALLVLLRSVGPQPL